MRYLLLCSLAALTCFGVFSLPQTSAAPKPDQSNAATPSNLQLLGANCLTARTLVVTYQIKTKQGKEGQLIVTRYLINEGKTEVVVFILKLNTEPGLP